jgi:hypothetical protein
MKIIGNKNNIEKGYVYAPYIPIQTKTEVMGKINSRYLQTVASRFATAWTPFYKKRADKNKKILDLLQKS